MSSKTLRILARPVFKYDPLESERFIHLLRISNSDRWDDPMELSLTTYLLSEGAIPKYTAFSYTWGESGRNVEVSADGARTTITESLTEALRHLRKTQQARDDINGFWWIDMLCINQQCIPERNHQVAMMREFLQGASLVLVWLRTTNRFEYGTLDNPTLQVPSQASDHPVADDYRGLPDTSVALRRTRNILSRPYWNRVWIIQELCVARDIITMSDSPCMSRSTFLHDVFGPRQPVAGVQASIFTNTLGNLSVSDFRLLIPYNLITLRQNICNNGRKTSLGSLLTFASQSEATNPHDKVYSLLGLANDVSEGNIPLDYSLSPCAMYRATIRVAYESICSSISDARSEATAISSSCSHNILTKEDGRWKTKSVQKLRLWCCLDLASVDSSAQSISVHYVGRDLLGFTGRTLICQLGFWQIRTQMTSRDERTKLCSDVEFTTGQ